MDIYNYDSITNEFVSTEPAELDPLEGLPLVPAFSTLTTVIPVANGNVAVFTGAGWEEQEDNRGIVYDTTTSIPQRHTDLGPLPSSVTALVPSSTDKWDGSAWVTDFDDIRKKQKDVILVGFNNALSAGLVTTTTLKMDSTYGDVMKLDGGVRLAEALSHTELTIRDFDNTVVVVSIADAKTIVNELGVNYQTMLQTKWDIQTQIDQAIDDKNTIEAIVWV